MGARQSNFPPNPDNEQRVPRHRHRPGRHERLRLRKAAESPVLNPPVKDLQFRGNKVQPVTKQAPVNRNRQDPRPGHRFRKPAFIKVQLRLPNPPDRIFCLI